MTNATRPAYALRLATLIAVAIVLLGPAPVHADTSVEIEARALLDGRYAAGGWLAVTVSLANDGAPTQGNLVADMPRGGVRRFVDMPAGSRKAVTLYLRPEAFSRSVTIRYETPEGATSTEIATRVLERSSRQVAIIGDGGGNLRPQILGADILDLPEPLAFGAGDIPERPEPLEGLASLVWADDSSGLTEGQRRSVERWVANGGQLVVIGGPDWQARTAAFVELLPVEALGAVDDVALDPLADWSGAEAPPVPSATLASGGLRQDAVNLVTTDEGASVLAMVNRGAGRVVYASVDLASDAFRGWDGGPSLWARLLPSDALVEQFFGPGFPVEEEAANSMSQALSNLPSLEVPPAELLLVVIVGYILLIGPVSYMVLRRLDRRELAWVTAPVLVILFTACSYGIGSSLKGSAVILNQITLVRSAAGGGAASVETYAGLFSPTRDSYDLTVEADALLASMRNPMFEQPRVEESSATSEQGNPAHLRGLAIGVFGFQAVRADAVIAHESDLLVTWRIGEDAMVGTVTNGGDEPYEDVAIVSSGGGEMVGDLEPGTSEEFELSLANFNGSSAADQVYGFGGFGGGFEGDIDPRQRQVLVRRQVIESLVGFGGFFPGGNMGFGTGIDRGPFVIGWRADEGPLPVTVDDQSVQRYAQTVEVVSGRPPLGPGEVRLAPSQLGIDVVSTDGDVSTNQPGFVTLGDGEVVFAISLPLEAAGLDPTSIRIVAGGDPGMVFQDPGGFGGILPAGYRLSVRDTASGEWNELGDLSQSSSFEVDDPSAVMSDTGRIEVRVVGTEVNDAFGQASVFVGAQVEGVIGR